MVDIIHGAFTGLYVVLTIIGIVRYAKERTEHFRDLLAACIGGLIGILISWILLIPFSWKIIVIMIIAMGGLGALYENILSEHVVGITFYKMCETFSGIYGLTHLLLWLFG